MFCTTCGFEMREGGRFCPQCGKSADKPPGETAGVNPAAQKRIMRDMRQKSIAGVCSGFANYLDVDVTLVRIVWLCSVFLWGCGVIAYLVCWIVMPKDLGDMPVAAAPSANVRSTETKSEAPPSNPETGSSPA